MTDIVTENCIWLILFWKILYDWYTVESLFLTDNIIIVYDWYSKEGWYMIDILLKDVYDWFTDKRFYLSGILLKYFMWLLFYWRIVHGWYTDERLYKTEIITNFVWNPVDLEAFLIKN